MTKSKASDWILRRQAELKLLRDKVAEKEKADLDVFENYRDLLAARDALFSRRVTIANELEEYREVESSS